MSPNAEITIPAGDLRAALDKLAELTHLQLLYQTDVVAPLHTPGVTAARTPQAALSTLLVGTGLSVTTDSSGAFFIGNAQPPNRNGTGAELPPVPESDGPPTQAQKAEPIDEVIISGTVVHLRPPVGTLGRSMTRDDLVTVGFGELPDLLRSIPETFGGGPNQDTHIGSEAQGNTALGTGINLRGLGARETLVLIDGRRVAPSGANGEFVDIMNIPTSAIESIDVLPDAAAARYGADAVGGVVNLKLRKELTGVENMIGAGSETRGDLAEYTATQTIGQKWDSGRSIVSLEVYHRGALPAADRGYATSNLLPLGGGNFDSNFSNPGNITNPATGQSWAIPTGQNGQHLTASALIPAGKNLQDRYQDAQIIPSQQRWTAYASAEQSLNDPVRLFTDILAAHRLASETFSGFGYNLSVPDTNPFYVSLPGTSTPVVVAYNFLRDIGPQRTRVNVDTLSATLGVDFDIAKSWSGEVYAAYSYETDREIVSGQVNLRALAMALADPNPLTAFNPFGDGSHTNPATLTAIQKSSEFTVGSALRVFDASVQGTLGHLRGGDVKFSGGADVREETFATLQALANTSSPGTTQELSRIVTSAFAESVVPLVGDTNRLPALYGVEITAAARYEYYGEAGSSLTPKIGLLWSPLPNIALRGTWSQSARSPTLGDLDDSHNAVGAISLFDPIPPPGQTVTALVWSGGNSAARSEHSVSWTGGMGFIPERVPGLSVDLTYFSTKITDVLEQPLLSANVLADRYYSPIVTRNPNADLVSYVCTHSAFPQGTTALCENLPVGALIDLRLRNLAVGVTRGVDFRGSYRLETDYGRLQIRLDGTRILNFAQAQTPQQPLFSLLDTQNNPLDLRLHGSVGWTFGGVGLQTAANFTNSYRDTASIPERRVGSWTTVDVQLSYDIAGAERPSLLQNTRIELDANNVFDRDPPFLNNQVVFIGYDQENANPYGRVLHLKLVKRW